MDYYYSAIKKEQTTDSHNSMHGSKMHLSQRSQIQKATYCMILFIWHSGKGKTTRMESSLMETGGRKRSWDKGEM